MSDDSNQEMTMNDTEMLIVYYIYDHGKKEKKLIAIFILTIPKFFCFPMAF